MSAPTGRALDAAVQAAVFAWEKIWIGPEHDRFPCWKLPKGKGTATWDSEPHYSTSRDALAIAEGKMEERGLARAYIKALEKEVRTLHMSNIGIMLLRIRRATPEQCCLALLATVEEAEHANKPA